MRRNFTLNIKRTLILVIALTALISMNPFFLWSTYDGIRIPGLGLGFHSVFLLLALMYSNARFFSDKKREMALLVIVCLLLEMIPQGVGAIPIGDLLSLTLKYVCYITLLFVPVDMLRKALKLFIIIYCAILVPSIIIYLLTTFGVSVRFTTIGADTGSNIAIRSYRRYFMSVINPSYEYRYCGIFDEPGVVGTTSAFLSIINNKSYRNKYCAIPLLLSGILSYSLAFILLIGIYIIMTMVLRRNKFTPLVIIFFLVAIYFILICRTDNMWILNIRDRMTSDTGLFINNRTTSRFDAAFSEFWNSGFFNKAFGNGVGASARNVEMASASEIRTVIYNLGIVGFALTILSVFFYWRCCFSNSKNAKYAQIIFLVVFFASMYQRPNIFQFYYLFILLGGTLSMNDECAIVEYVSNE